MVKSGADRSEKYDAKFDAEVVRSRFAATAEAAKRKQKQLQEDLAAAAGKVRGHLNIYGIFPVDTMKYVAYTNKLGAICRKFAANTAKNVARLEANKFFAYGLNEDVMWLIWKDYEDVLGEPPSPLPWEEP